MMERKSRIGIVAFWDRLAVPYLDKYEQTLKQMRIPYQSILWDRSVDGETTESKDHTELVIHRAVRPGLIGKIVGFLKWRKEAKRLLRNKRYAGLVILTTHPAVLLSSFLKRRYKDRYVFDIRDYTQEKYNLYRRLVMSLIDKSALTTISSKGFLRFLEPHQKIVPNHNITFFGQKPKKEFDFRTPITISFVGNVRLDRQTEAMLLTLANNPNYHLRFIGRILPECKIEQLIRERGIRNVSLEGAFTVQQKPEIYAGTQLINAVYANAAEHLALGDATPLPNRLYDAIVFYCPLLVSKGTYLAEIVDEYHLGLAVNGFDQDLDEQIRTYLAAFEPKEFLDGCARLYREIAAEEDVFLEKLRSVFTEWVLSYDR